MSSDHHKRRLNGLYEEYDTELSTIKEEFDLERNLTMSLHKDEIKHLQDVLFAMEQNQLEKETEARQEFQSTRDDIKNKVGQIFVIIWFNNLFQNLEDKHALRIQLESTVESLWKQFQSALKNYNETTEERKIAFENLKAKDDKSSKEIDTQMRKLQKLQVNNFY